MKWSDVSDLSWRDLKKTLKGMDREDVLHRLGLEEHTPTSDFFSGLGLFAVGVLIGAGLGIMFAPKPGAEIRSQLGGTIKHRTGRGEELPQGSGMPGTTSTVSSSRIS
ncbi:MAG TPA: YtxH domain-containing protein [Anaeromyxobacteraceae bacterium]|nr:YtxH domain-containing protein [Anaeromyxobacteraceae bacterium]